MYQPYLNVVVVQDWAFIVDSNRCRSLLLNHDLILSYFWDMSFCFAKYVDAINPAQLPR
jgi:hypothetical protein